MKRVCFVGLFVLLALVACQSPQREARQMARRADRLFDTMPDSTFKLIDSILRMPVYFNEKHRMDMALLQGEALFGDRGQEIPPLMDDEFFDDKPFLTASPDLERAAAYYADKKQYAKAAKAALYSGFVQQHYGEKTHAMQSFKVAERYGEMVKDSLTVARAECLMGKLLYDDYMESEAIIMFKSANDAFGNHFTEKAMVQNMMSVCYMLQRDYENAEKCLQQSMAYAKQSNIDKVRIKILNNYAVLYRQQRKFGQSMEYLRLIAKEFCLDNSELFMFYLNSGKTFLSSGEIDSASYYFHRMEKLLPETDLKPMTKVSAYEALFRLVESQNHDSLALQYHVMQNSLLYEVLSKQREQSIYRIQQQYDHENLQNALNQKLIRRHRISFLVGVIAILGLVALVVSQIRLARIRKQEAEAKVNLFHFMQQNDVLKQKHEEYAKLHTKLIREQTEKEKLNQDLQQKNAEYKIAYQDYAEKFSIAKNREQNIVMKLAIYLKNMGATHSLDGLKHAVFDNQTPWEAIFRIFDDLYPNVRENLLLKHPDLTESEQKDFMLSFFGVSRQDEADMLGTTVHTVDKLRNSVRKKLREASKEA